MPEKWVEPEIFLNYRGIVVCHQYRFDDYEDIFEFWYTVDENEFDIRDLGYKESQGVSPREFLKDRVDQDNGLRLDNEIFIPAGQHDPEAELVTDKLAELGLPADYSILSLTVSDLLNYLAEKAYLEGKSPKQLREIIHNLQNKIGISWEEYLDDCLFPFGESIE